MWCVLCVDCGGWSRWRVCGACAVRCLSCACAWTCMCVSHVLVAWRLGSGSAQWLVVAPPWYVRGCLLAYRTNSVAVCIYVIKYLLASSVLYHHVIILVASAAASSDGLSRGPRVYGPNKYFWSCSVHKVYFHEDVSAQFHRPWHPAGQSSRRSRGAHSFGEEHGRALLSDFSHRLPLRIVAKSTERCGNFFFVKFFFCDVKWLHVQCT